MWQFRRVNFLVGSCLGVIFGLKLWVVFVGGSFFPRGEFSGSNYLGDFFGRGRFFFGGGGDFPGRTHSGGSFHRTARQTSLANNSFYKQS